MFYVKVPVLSEHIQLVDPRVSTDSKFFTKTFSLLNLLAATVKLTVIVKGSPSGTIAKIIPKAN